MKYKKLLIFGLALALSSCSYVQIIYTRPLTSSVKEATNGAYVYEDSSVRLTYNFWAEKGIMSFVVENKLNVPIYIDWQKCSFVDQRVKEDYYTNTTSYNYTTAYTGGNNYYPVSVINGTEQKEEKITFIPPGAQVNRDQFMLTPGIGYVKMNGSGKEEMQLEGTSKNIKVKVLNADKDDSQIFFSNFITYSTQQNFEKEHYINTGFYVDKVVQVQEKYRDNYQNAKRFYLASENKH